MLIATAGHIDHGKTALVRALTGVETDRLPEEKARGISIDLGFAYWRQDDGSTIGFVDVPGHERFIRNMLAGVSGVEFALVVVAADDGVMPQTVEHVQILDLLGIARGAIAITKCDKVSTERIAQVRQQIAALLAPTTLAGAPVFPVATLAGIGIAELASALRQGRIARPTPGDATRLAIDRCFTVAGTGTVVTGTLHAGNIAAGQHLVLAPRGLPVRVRSLQSAGRSVAEVRAGERCAAGLVGIDVAQVHRGDWLVPVEQSLPTSRFAARVHVLPARTAPLRHASSVHLHIGTAAIPARVLIRRQRNIAPGESTIATVVLDEPTLAMNGERFVLRDASGRELIGGGRVIDPRIPARQRHDETREAIVAALERHEPAQSLVALLAIPGHETDATAFARSFNLQTETAAGLFANSLAQLLGREPRIVVASARIATLGGNILDQLAAHHAAHPESGGPTRRELRLQLAQPVSVNLLDWLLRDLADAGKIAFAGPLIRLPGHVPSFGREEIALWELVQAMLAAAAPKTVSSAELALLLHESEATLHTMLSRRRANGDLWAIDAGRFMLREHVSALAASAAGLAADDPAGFTAAQFRDATGIGRNHVIRILEFFDRIGVTARKGAARVVRSDYESIVGTAAPYLAGPAADISAASA